MGDAALAIVRSPALWSAVIATVIYLVMLRDPSFPKPLLDLYVGIVISVLSAVGITGVVGVVPAVKQARAIKASRAASPVSAFRHAPGQQSFEAYALFMGGSGADGKPIPNWPNLSALTQSTWAAAEAAVKGL